MFHKAPEPPAWPEVRRLSVIGLGYIGLPTAALFAQAGLQVSGMDISPSVVAGVAAGRVHLVEPGLEPLVAAAVQAGRLHASQEIAEAEAYLIAVPTPFCADRQPDLSYVKAAALAIAPKLRPGALVILESTVPVGTTEAMALWLAAARPDLSFPQDAAEMADILVAHCPERVLPGRALAEMASNDRVIGGLSRRSGHAAEALYRRIVTGDCLLSDARTAEMCKLTENAARDVQIAFANELAGLCQKFDIDVWQLIALANRHPRVEILRPGPGVGGHCIAVDPWFLVASAPEETPLIQAARAVNDARPLQVLADLRAVLAPENGPQVVALLGLSFKPDIDDLRASPALRIAQDLAAEGLGEIWVVEPHLTELPAALAARGAKLVSLECAQAKADVLCALVRHSAFPDLGRSLRSGQKLLDYVGLGPSLPSLHAPSSALSRTAGLPAPIG